MDRRERIGIVAACCSSLLGGVSVVATRAVVGAVDPVVLASLRYGIGALCLLPLAAAARAAWPARGDRAAAVALGILFFAAFAWLFNTALAYTTAARGSLALSTLPLLTLVIAALLRAEPLTGAKLAGVAVAMLGVAVALSGRLAGTVPPGAWRGDLIMIATALCGAFYNVLSRPYLKRYPALSWTACGMRSGTAALALAIVLAPVPPHVPAADLATWGPILFLGVAGAALTFWLWSYGLERTTPTRVAITVTLNPMVSMLLAPLVLQEGWSPRLFVGLAAVASGIALTTGQGPAVIAAARDALRPWLDRR